MATSTKRAHSLSWWRYDEAARLNNRVLRERPEGLFVAFHAATDMLIRLHGADAYFLNYAS